MKKILILILSLVLSLSLVACSNDVKDVNENTGDLNEKPENIVVGSEDSNNQLEEKDDESKLQHINIEKEKVEWLKIKKDEEIEIFLNNKMKKIKCSLFNLDSFNYGDYVYECYRLVEFIDVDTGNYFSTDNSISMGDEEFEMGKMIDIVTGKEYLIFKINAQNDNILIICNDNMEICAKFDIYDDAFFYDTQIIESGEKKIVPIEECFNTEIVYYDLYGIGKEYFDNISYEYKHYEKNKNEKLMALRKITIENGIIKDEPIKFYTDYELGQVM